MRMPHVIAVIAALTATGKAAGAEGPYVSGETWPRQCIGIRYDGFQQ